MQRAIQSPWLPLLLIFGFCACYLGSYDTLFMGDEFFAYFHPTLVMKENPSNFLPWNYHPQMTFGHPPLSYLFYALGISIWNDIFIIRFLSVILTSTGIYGAWLVGNTLRNRQFGFILAVSYLSHFALWQIANLFLVDNLLVAGLTFFLYFCLKKNRWGVLISGILLVLLRESFAICVFAFFLKEFFDYLRGSSSKLLIPLLLIGTCSAAWLFLIFISGGHPTAYYNNQGFIFTWSFFSRTFSLLFYSCFIYSGWIILPILVAVLGFQKREAFRKVFFDLWYLLVIPAVFFISLSFIENSIERYQLVSLFCCAVFAMTYLFDVLPLKIVYGIILTLFAINFVLKDNFINHYEKRNLAPAESFYECARQLRNWNPASKVNVIDFELVYLIRHLKVFTEFKLENFPLRMRIINRFRPDLDDDYDYLVLVRNKGNYLNNFTRRVLARPDMKEVHPPGTEACLIIRKD